MSAPLHLSPAHRAVLETFTGEVLRTRQEERDQTLREMSSVLMWLTAKPAYTPEYLASMVLKQFSNSADKLPEDSAARRIIAHYRDHFAKLEGGAE